MTIKINGTNTTAQPSITGPDTDTGLVYGDNDVKIVTGGTDRLKVDGSGNLIQKFPGKFKMQEGNNLAWSFHSNGAGGSLLFTDESDSTEQVRFQGTGGISFNGDTAAANALDDYEEGTWSPAIQGQSNAGTFSGTQLGNYTKIGRQVLIQVRIQNYTLTGATGTVMITGLPFVAASDMPYSVTHVGMTLGVSFTTSRNQSLYGAHGTSNIFGIQSASGASWVSWDVSNFIGSGKYLQFAMTYAAV